MIVHMAAIAFVGYGDLNAFYNINVIGTRNLLQAVHRSSHPLDAILIARSANVYGNSIGGRLAETTPTDPLKNYAFSKLAMEYIAKLWSDKFPIFITRLFNYIGVGQADNLLLPKLVKLYKENAAMIKLENIDIWRDFTDIRALSKAYVAMLKIRQLGETINICSGKTYSLLEAIRFCEKITGYYLEILVNTVLFARTK